MLLVHSKCLPAQHRIYLIMNRLAAHNNNNLLTYRVFYQMHFKALYRVEKQGIDIFTG